ncbi:MAG: hypothetical protein K8S98_01335 [Planctomycetes bacterium]|nr:hypothetical protein [Planctomycetota bacterium]
MFKPQDGIGPRGAWVPGPPWILGKRGAPRVAPENTRAGLNAALKLGVDGLHYEVRATGTGELVLHADPTLDRTSDARGRLASRTWVELADVDFGGWFGRAFLGERLTLLDEALALAPNHATERPMHVIELAETGLVDVVARALAKHASRLTVRVASARREVCVQARTLGLSAMLLVDRPGDSERRFADEEELTACASDARGFLGAELSRSWPCERWAVDVDRPDELFAACRAPLFGLSTTEPERALAIRALVRLAPECARHPLAALPLIVEPRASTGTDGAWRGDWTTRARVENPFGFRVAVHLAFAVRRGAFECRGLPEAFALEAGETREFEFALAGGAWSPGGDPLLLARYDWSRGPGRPSEALVLDAPIERVRVLSLGLNAERLFLLPEAPNDPPASLNVRRKGPFLLLAIENPGGLGDAQLVAHVDGAHFRGGKGLKLRLPSDFPSREHGVAFSAGIVGRRDGRECLRRWAGGLPSELEGGVPGRLLPRSRA